MKARPRLSADFFTFGAIVGAGRAHGGQQLFSSPIVTGAVTGGLAGVVGFALALFIGNRQAKWARAQLERGGLLLWARTWTEEREREATSVMQRNGGHHVHVHAVSI